jgi:DNA-binding MarR family transcriptional regulator
MNQKQIGVAILIFGILLSILVFMFKAKEDVYINAFVDEMGTCYLADGTCLHQDRDFSVYIIGGVISLALIILGIYLLLFDKTQKVLEEHQVKVSSALKEATKKDHFTAFLGGFDSEEQIVLKAVHEQEGITQSTLRYRTGMSKTSLSLLLKSLEEKEIISRKKSGKTNEVFLRKKF